ncbi:MAG: hypothetical protein P8Y45_12665, partial [Exilibacterium sp.]
ALHMNTMSISRANFNSYIEDISGKREKLTALKGGYFFELLRFVWNIGQGWGAPWGIIETSMLTIETLILLLLIETSIFVNKTPTL